GRPVGVVLGDEHAPGNVGVLADVALDLVDLVGGQGVGLVAGLEHAEGGVAGHLGLQLADVLAENLGDGAADLGNALDLAVRLAADLVGAGRTGLELVVLFLDGAALGPEVAVAL